MARKSKPKEMNFEVSLDRLERIVEMLESGDTPLTEAVKLYEEGINLSKNCLKQLNEVETKLKKITKDVNGNFITTEITEGIDE